MDSYTKYSMNEKLTTIEKIGGWVSTLLLGQTKEIIVRTDERVLGLMDSMKDVKKTVEDFRVSITAHSANIDALKVHTKYGITNSPTVPNEEGTKLLQDSKFTEQYPSMKSKIFTLMDTMNPRTLYDYETGAIAALEKLQNDPLIDPIKNYIVSNPDATLELIFKIASWVIRDDYDAYKKGEGVK